MPHIAKYIITQSFTVNCILERNRCFYFERPRIYFHNVLTPTVKTSPKKPRKRPALLYISSNMRLAEPYRVPAMARPAGA